MLRAAWRANETDGATFPERQVLASKLRELADRLEARHSAASDRRTIIAHAKTHPLDALGEYTVVTMRLDRVRWSETQSNKLTEAYEDFVVRFLSARPSVELPSVPYVPIHDDFNQSSYNAVMHAWDAVLGAVPPLVHNNASTCELAYRAPFKKGPKPKCAWCGVVLGDLYVASWARRDVEPSKKHRFHPFCATMLYIKTTGKENV